MQSPVVIAQPPGFKGSVKGQVGAVTEALQDGSYEWTCNGLSLRSHD
jgi:hypothetical protein